MRHMNLVVLVVMVVVVEERGADGQANAHVLYLHISASFIHKIQGDHEPRFLILERHSCV